MIQYLFLVLMVIDGHDYLGIMEDANVSVFLNKLEHHLFTFF